MSTPGTLTVQDPKHKTRVDRPTTKSRRDVIPPLENGDHLSRAEFERRYSAYPDMKKAELIEGVVYVPSPVSLEHAEPHSRIITLLGTYLGATPGTRLADNVTIRLDLDNEVQPDASLWLDEEVGGKARATEEGYLSGSPELIVEVAASSAAYDLHEKQRVYRRNGVQEYLVLLAYEQEVIWYALEEGEYRPITADENGILRSRVFPDLYFHAELFWAGDLAGLLAVLKQGVDSAEHIAFVTRLQEAKASAAS